MILSLEQLIYTFGQMCAKTRDSLINYALRMRRAEAECSRFVLVAEKPRHNCAVLEEPAKTT